MVPNVDPGSSATFHWLGVILTHGFILTGFYPICIVEAVSTKLLASGSQPCCNEVLLSSLLNYVSPLERVAMEAALNGPDKVDPQHLPPLVDPLGRMQCRSIPTSRPASCIVMC